MMVGMFMGMLMKVHYDLSYVTSSEELANVMLLMASSKTSRETAVPLVNVGTAESAYAVMVYVLTPGPFEHGGA
jgi:hypothetical protein